jgi:hypothetical protein
MAATALLAGVARSAGDAAAAPPSPPSNPTVDAELKTAKAINRGGAAGLIRAGGQITAVDLVDIATHSRQATFTATERKQLAAVIRRGVVSGSSSPTGSPWDRVYLIRTRSLGVYVAQLWDDQVLTVEVPDQLTKPDPPGVFSVVRKRGEILIADYVAFRSLRRTLEQRLGQPTKEEFRPFDLTRIPVPPEIREEQERRQQGRPWDKPIEKR